MNYEQLLKDINNLTLLESNEKQNSIKEIESILVSNMFLENEISNSDDLDLFRFQKSKSEIEKKGFAFSNITIPLKDKKLKITYDTTYYPEAINKKIIYTFNNVNIKIDQYISYADIDKTDFNFGYITVKHDDLKISLDILDLAQVRFSAEFSFCEEESAPWNKIIQAAYEISSDNKKNDILTEAKDLLLIKYDLDLDSKIHYKELFDCFFNFYSLIKNNNFKLQKNTKKHTL